MGQCQKYQGKNQTRIQKRINKQKKTDPRKEQTVKELKTYSMKKLMIALILFGAGALTAQTKHLLPPLPYTLGAWQPVMRTETLEFPHGKHVQAYVDNLNKLIPGTA